jgi:hypothetical protein
MRIGRKRIEGSEKNYTFQSMDKLSFWTTLVNIKINGTTNMQP